MQSPPFSRAASRWLLLSLSLMVVVLAAWRDSPQPDTPMLVADRPMPLPTCAQVQSAMGGLLQGMQLNPDVERDLAPPPWPEISCTWREPVLMNKGLTVKVSKPVEEEVDWLARLQQSPRVDDPRLAEREVVAYMGAMPKGQDDPLGTVLTVGNRHYRVAVSGLAMMGLSRGYPNLTLPSALEGALNVYDTAAAVPGVVLRPMH